MDHKHHIRIGWLTIFTIVVVSVLIIFRTTKTASFLKALEQLVATGTKGMYKLNIGDAQFYYADLAFVLHNIRLSKTDSVASGGVEAVVIPRLDADFGSLASFFAIGQLKIHHIQFEEPHIILRPSADRKTTASVTEEVVSLAKAIEAILQRFDVQNLSISRGQIDVEKKGDNHIELGLIDLLVSDWNMRQLTSGSKVSVIVEGQQLIVGGLSVGFSAIEYQYPQHYLSFDDVNILKLDSTHHTSVRAKTIHITGLDYEELYRKGKYKLRKIEIEAPEISTQVISKGAGKNGFSLSTIYPEFQRLFGDLDLDSVVISNGKVDINVRNKQHYTNVKIGQLDLAIAGIALKIDTSETGIQDIRVKLKGASIKIDSAHRIACDTAIFINKEKLSISGLRVNSAYDQINVFVRYLQVDDVSIPINEQSTTVKTGPIIIDYPNVRIRKKLSGTGHEKEPGTPSFDIQSLRINHANLSYHQENTKIDLVEFSMLTGKLRDTYPLLSGLKEFHTDAWQISLSDSISLRGRNASADNNEFTLEHLVVERHQLQAILDGIDIRQDSLFHLNPNDIRIGKLDAGSIRVSGKFSDSEPAAPNKKNVAIRIKEIGAGKLSVDVQSGPRRISFTGNQLVVQNLDSREKKKISSLSGFIRDFQITEPARKISLESIALNTSGRSLFKNGRGEIGDKTLTFGSLALGPIQSGDSLHLSEGSLRDISISQGTTLSAKIDSLQFQELEFLGKVPSVDNLTIFHPVVSFHKGTSTKPTETGVPNREWSENLHRFSVYNAKMNGETSTMSFASIAGEIVKGDVILTGRDFFIENMNSQFRMAGFRQSKKTIELAGLKLNPTEYALNRGIQVSLIEADIQTVTLKGKGMFQLLQGDTNLETIAVENATLDIRRDKRLPMPPQLEKPFLLSELVPGTITFKDARIKNANIQYHEISTKTERSGVISINDIDATVKNTALHHGFSGMSLSASAKLYNKGLINLSYVGMDSSSFALTVDARDIDLMSLNDIILPLQLVRIRNGRLRQLNVEAKANPEFADASTNITYDNLHIEFFKHEYNDEDRKSLGSELLTLLADGILLKNSKVDAAATTNQPRNKEKSVFDYWVKIVMHGSLEAIRHGKSNSRKKR